MTHRGVVIAIMLALAALGACALVAAGPPDDACRADTDCFRAQGEVCNLETNRCETAPDAPPVDASTD